MRHVQISDSYYKSNETTAEKLFEEDICKGKTCIKVIQC